MALYVYRCEGCGNESEEFRPMERRDDAPVCECGQHMRRVQQPTPHRWVATNGQSVRAPGSEWDWPDGKPFEPNEFAARNPRTREAVAKRAHEIASGEARHGR